MDISMSRTISLSGTSSILKANFYPPIVLDEEKEYGIGLIDFHTFYSIPNVSESNNIIKIGKINLEIPIGSWEIDELESWINSQLQRKSSHQKNVFHLKGNLNTMKCEMMCETDDIDLTSFASIAPLLGFERGIYKKSTTHESNLPVQITTVDDIRIECSVATGSFDQDRPANLIYAFYPDVPPGYKIIQRPSTIIYYPLNTNTISDIKVRILDQRNRLIDFRRERITLRLHLKEL